MKVKTVAMLAALGMTLTSWTVWSVTDPRSDVTAIEPDDPDPPVIATGTATIRTTSFAQFTAGQTLMLEGRLGHARLLADRENESSCSCTFRPSRPRAPSTSRPLNLAIVLDRSGSMKGQAAENAISAASGMLRRLRDGDVVSVVAYNTSTEILAPPTTIDAGSRERVIASLDRLDCPGRHLHLVRARRRHRALAAAQRHGRSSAALERRRGDRRSARRRGLPQHRRAACAVWALRSARSASTSTTTSASWRRWRRNRTGATTSSRTRADLAAHLRRRAAVAGQAPWREAPSSRCELGSRYRGRAGARSHVPARRRSRACSARRLCRGRRKDDADARAHSRAAPPASARSPTCGWPGMTLEGRGKNDCSGSLALLLTDDASASRRSIHWFRGA